MARRHGGARAADSRGRRSALTVSSDSSLAGVRALYISYFGLREPLVQTQVLPYLRELVSGGARVFLLTFEPERRKRWDGASLAEWSARLRSEGIEWEAAPYHKRPTLPATLFDVITGALRVIRIARRHRISIIHARSHVPAMMGALAKRFTKAKLIFDVRGLMADEYADTGHWKRGGALYRLTKRAERWLMRSADGFVVLTDRVQKELFAQEARPVEVIPCCIDQARFTRVDATQRDRLRESLGAREKIVVVYVGALGEMYLPREMADFFAAAKAADARVFPLILTQSRAELITSHLAAHGFGPGDYHIAYVGPAELPAHLAASDAAISFVRPCYSKIASSPTKFAEYLASGLPVLSTRGIGDLDAQIEGERVGVLLDEFDVASYRAAFARLVQLRADAQLGERCIRFAAAAYDLAAVGGARYRRLYARVMKSA
jgi:glycosyltransferase involved in cell wall biosynthesis